MYTCTPLGNLLSLIYSINGVFEELVLPRLPPKTIPDPHIGVSYYKNTCTRQRIIKLPSKFIAITMPRLLQKSILWMGIIPVSHFPMGIQWKWEQTQRSSGKRTAIGTSPSDGWHCGIVPGTPRFSEGSLIYGEFLFWRRIFWPFIGTLISLLLKIRFVAKWITVHTPAREVISLGEHWQYSVIGVLQGRAGQQVLRVQRWPKTGLHGNLSLQRRTKPIPADLLHCAVVVWPTDQASDCAMNRLIQTVTLCLFSCCATMCNLCVSCATGTVCRLNRELWDAGNSMRVNVNLTGMRIKLNILGNVNGNDNYYTGMWGNGTKHPLLWHL